MGKSNFMPFEKLRVRRSTRQSEGDFWRVESRRYGTELCSAAVYDRTWDLGGLSDFIPGSSSLDGI